jgi:hypothetical protein
MRFSKKMLPFAGAIVAALTLFGMRSHLRTHKKTVTVGAVEDRLSQPTTHDSEKVIDERKKSEVIRLLIPWCLLVASIGFSAFAIYAAENRQPRPAWTAVLIALAMSAFLIRGPRNRLNVPAPTVTVIFIFTAAFEFFILITAVLRITFLTVFSGHDPAELLQVVVLCVCTLGIIIFVVVSHTPGWPFTEPLVLGSFAIVIGALCLPVINLIAVPHIGYNPRDAAELYATGGANDGLTLDVQVAPLGPPPTKEVFRVDNHANHRINWVLLVVGGARLKQVAHSTTDHIEYQTSNIFNPYFQVQKQTQIISGSVNGNSSVSFSGSSFGQFDQSAGSQSVVALPTYEQGTTGLNSPEQTQPITDALKGYATVRPWGRFSVIVSSGHLPPVYALGQVSPNMTPSPADPAELRWFSNSSIQANYVAVNPGLAAEHSEVLFVFAVLLGLAGAALIGSVQGVVHILSSRKPT